MTINETFKMIKLESGELVLRIPNSFAEDVCLEEGDIVNVELLPNDCLQIKLKDKHRNEVIAIYLKKQNVR